MYTEFFMISLKIYSNSILGVKEFQLILNTFQCIDIKIPIKPYIYIVMDNNTYYTCKCIYFDTGYIPGKVCAQWAENIATKPKDELVIIAKRWCRSNYYK